MMKAYSFAFTISTITIWKVATPFRVMLNETVYCMPKYSIVWTADNYRGAIHLHFFQLALHFVRQRLEKAVRGSLPPLQPRAPRFACFSTFSAFDLVSSAKALQKCHLDFWRLDISR